MSRRIEWGVIIDRTSRGLGYYLESVWGTRGKAEERRDLLTDRDGLPVTVKVREVITSEWVEVD